MEERNRYKNLQELVDEIKEYLQNGGQVTLALNYKWWAKRICSPWEEKVPKDAILFSEEFGYEEILKVLEQNGCQFKRHIALPCFGRVVIQAA